VPITCAMPSASLLDAYPCAVNLEAVGGRTNECCGIGGVEWIMKMVVWEVK
jgi:hypothetical protein